MTPLPKHLEEMRDASANDYSNQQIKFYHSVCRDEYKAGFNQAVSILLKDMEEMAKALDEILWQDKERAEITAIAREALKNYREKIGDCK